jgi:hypothetical protein
MNSRLSRTQERYKSRYLKWPSESRHEQKSDWKASLKIWIDIFQGLFTIGAILAAGFWFFDQESLKPQIKLEQTITQRPLDGQPDETLIAVDVRVTNLSKVRVKLSDGRMWLAQINPVPGKDLTDESLKDLQLDPGEGDQAFFKTYIVSNDIRTIQLTSRYMVPNEKNYDWELESAADLGPQKPDKTSAVTPK